MVTIHLFLEKMIILKKNHNFTFLAKKKYTRNNNIVESDFVEIGAS
jgi:hypothetical protein